MADGRTLICPSAPLASSLSSRGLGHGGDGRAGFLLPARPSSLQQRCRAACCDTPHPTALSELGSVPDSDSAEAPVNRPSEISRSEPVQALGELRALALAQAAERLARRDPAALGFDPVRLGARSVEPERDRLPCPRPKRGTFGSTRVDGDRLQRSSVAASAIVRSWTAR